MAEAWYCTRESVMASPDIKAAAYASERIDAAIAAGADAVDKLVHLGARNRGIPGFAPWQGTLEFDWPNSQGALAGQFYLDQHTLITLDSFTSGGIIISPTSAFLEPAASGPPYRSVRLNRATNTYFTIASGVGQRSLALTGLWGWNNRERVSSTVSGALNASVELVTSAAAVGVGSILRVDAERMLVTGKNWVSSTQSATLAANNSAQMFVVADASVFRPGEEILLDAERMLIRDITSNALIVQRAWGGSALAAHTSALIYFAHQLVVERGALGTTAASHLSGATVNVWEPPPLIATLNRAYAIDTFFQEGSGYARTIGSQESEREFNARGLRALEERVYGAYGRRPRTRAV